MVNWRDRVVEMRRVPASELNANPKNWREHPPEQQRAMQGVLEEVGIAGALLARETPDGLELIDGHLRTEMNDATEWPVLILDVDENEADVLLASVDPIGALAKTNTDQLAALLGQIETDNADLDSLLTDLSDSLPTQIDDDNDNGNAKLADRFGVPPFSVLNAREGWWQDRKRAWLALGIQSELGRGETESDASFKSQDKLNAMMAGKR